MEAEIVGYRRELSLKSEWMNVAPNGSHTRVNI